MDLETGLYATKRDRGISRNPILRPTLACTYPQYYPEVLEPRREEEVVL